MCSAANYALPLRRTCEVLATPGRLCGGVSMPTNFPGARSYGSPQDTDMDLAWQELMAITELQEFEVPSQGPYEMTQYHPMEPVIPMGGYGPSQSHSEALPTACELNPVAACESSYSEVVPACHRIISNAEAMYGHYGSQLNPRIVPTSHAPQPSLMVNMSGTSEGHRKPNICLSQGFNRHGQNLHPSSADDLESDSGLSLGSSPPLASPDNPMTGVPTFQNTDVGLTFSDGEVDMTEQASRAQLQYAMDYQNQSHSYTYSGAHSSYFPAQPNASHTQGTPSSLKQQHGLTGALSDLCFNGSGVSSRGSSHHSLYNKTQGNSSAPTPLSRDERRALSLKIPFQIDKIINLPVDDFNELLTQYTLNDSQMALVRDIRRRGKNKVAAQNCRKRKLDNIIHLEGELGQLQAQRDHLAQERLEFQHSLAYVKCRLSELYAEVFSHLRDEEGQPYSIDQYSLQQTPDGKIYLVPRTAMQGRE